MIAQRKIRFQVGRGFVTGILHISRNLLGSNNIENGVIMVSGAGGGFQGPSGIYDRLANTLAKHEMGIVCIRIHYRFPNILSDCVQDVDESINYLEREYGVKRVIEIGWSFGGAVVLQSSAKHPRVIGVATIASQTAGAIQPVQRLAKKGTALLLIHGTEDSCLSDECSRHLFALARNHPNKKLKLFVGDNHGITNHAAEMMNLLVDFCIEVFQKSS